MGWLLFIGFLVVVWLFTEQPLIAWAGVAGLVVLFLIRRELQAGQTGAADSFTRSLERQITDPPAGGIWLKPGNASVEVVGESSYDAAIERLMGQPSSQQKYLDEIEKRDARASRGTPLN